MGAATRVLKSALLIAAILAVARTGVADLIGLAMIPVGANGNLADTAAHSGNAAGQGAVSYPYQIGKYEVTAGQYTVFLNAVAGVDAYSLYSTGMSSSTNGSGIVRTGDGTPESPYSYAVDPAFVNRPVNLVSWGDAARFCNWLANGQPTGAQSLTTTESGSYYLNGANTNVSLMAVTRKVGATWFIPTEDEWYKAAYHKNDGNTANYFTYPTGSNAIPGRDMADPLPGNNANYMGTPYPIDSGKYTTLVGEFQNSPSPYGTFDQGGNVWEWNEANVFTSDRGLRGGAASSLVDGSSLDKLASYYRNKASPTFEGLYVGFRVARVVPEPGCMSLLLVGFAFLLLPGFRRILRLRQRAVSDSNG